MRLALPIAVLLATASGLAAAQAMYRSTMPDGKVVISDQPVKGATKVEEVKSRTGNYAPGNPVKPGAAGPATDRSAALAAAETEFKAAQAAYDAAVSRAEKGREEREGDRVGTYKGGARLSDAYEKRQESLKAEVDAARQNLDAARRKLNDAR